MLKMIQWLPISLRIKPKLVPMTCKAYLVFFLLPVPFCLIPVFPLITIFQPHWFSFHFISFNMPNIFSPQNSYIYSSLCPEWFSPWFSQSFYLNTLSQLLFSGLRVFSAVPVISSNACIVICSYLFYLFDYDLSYPLGHKLSETRYHIVNRLFLCPD